MERADLYAGFARQAIEVDRQNACAVAAVIRQESGFQVNPVVPNLPAIAWREIDTRAAHSNVPGFVVHGALSLPSRTAAGPTQSGSTRRARKRN